MLKSVSICAALILAAAVFCRFRRGKAGVWWWPRHGGIQRCPHGRV